MKLVIAGGGTGGHLFPGIALGEEVLARSPSNQVLFVGTARGIEAREVPKAGFPLELIDVTGLKGKGLWALVSGLFRLPWALLSSLRILGRHRPDVVLGVGGYSSGPVLLAARLRGIPTAIQEQNAAPGITNRLLGRIVRLVFTAFPEAEAFFPAAKVRQLGNPIRRSLLDNFLKPHPRAEPDRFSLLVIGGSQGAHAINLVLPEAVKRLPADLGSRLRILHQTGARDRASVGGADFTDGESRSSGEAGGRRLHQRHVRRLRVGQSGRRTSRREHAGRAGRLPAGIHPDPVSGRGRRSSDQERGRAGPERRGGGHPRGRDDARPPRPGDPGTGPGPGAYRAHETASFEGGSSNRLEQAEAREIGEVLSQLAVGSPNPGQRASPTRPVED